MYSNPLFTPNLIVFTVFTELKKCAIFKDIPTKIELFIEKYI